MEVKLSASPRVDDVRHFAMLDRLGKRGAGALICLAPEGGALTRVLTVVPASGL